MAFAAETFRTLPNNKATKLPNITCVYCGGEHTVDNPLTDEHVVGRKFVPKGSLATGWSLIVRACEHCNNEKSDLENDISAITLLPDLGTSHDRAALAELAQRKAEGARSRRTGKPVANSYEEQTVEGTLMSAIDVRFGFTAPPQIAPERVMRLARFHLQAFFYFVTYDESARSGREAFRQRRCLVPLDSFYEWKKTASGKQPYVIALKDRRLMGMAGLWETWRSPAGERIRSFTIITTPPNELCAALHNRMPAVLKPEAWPTWLGEQSADVPQLKALLAPYPSEDMISWPVSARVGNVKNNDPSLIEAIAAA